MNPKPPFETVVTTHGATVLRVCRAVLRPADADDAWSETFLAAMKAYPDLPEEANVQAWLVTIAHRKAIDVTRAAARRAVPRADATDSAAVPAADNRDLELNSDLADAFGNLTVRQRQAIAYHHLAGLPYTEVAAIVGGRPDAARRAAADGIATLRRTYSGVTSRKEESR
ncbi:MAG: RNA polymerase sigma factor [Acidimicrobiia bacterium]